MRKLLIAKIVPEMLIPFLICIMGVLMFYYIGKGVFLAAKMQGGMPTKNKTSEKDVCEEDKKKLEKLAQKTRRIMSVMFTIIVILTIAIALYNYNNNNK